MLLLQELQRLKIKCEEALSESKGLREECGRLTSTVETLRAAANETASDDSSNTGESTLAVQPGMGKEVKEGVKGEEDLSSSVRESREEILCLRKTIEELERAREEVDLPRSRVERGDQEEGKGDETGGETMKEATREVFEERDSLRAELGEEKQKAAARVAGLEMQLADQEVRILPNQQTDAATPPPPPPVHPR